MSFTMLKSVVPALLIFAKLTLICSSMSSSSIRSVRPITTLSGVLSSWLILARKDDLALLAAIASSSISLRRVTSRPIAIIPTTSPSSISGDFTVSKSLFTPSAQGTHSSYTMRFCSFITFMSLSAATAAVS